MFSKIPPATRALIIANVLCFLLQLLAGDGFTERFALQPPGPEFAPWQVLTYAFLHDTRNFAHIFFNMFGLWMFGSVLENFWGARRFLTFYIASVLAAAATQLVVDSATHSPYSTVGASGGLFGLLLAFAFYFPQQRIVLLFPPIPMPAWLFVTLYGIIELFLGVTNSQQGVAHFAHLGGMVGGALMILLWRAQGSPPRRPF